MFVKRKNVPYADSYVLSTLDTHLKVFMNTTIRNENNVSKNNGKNTQYPRFIFEHA